MSNTLVYTEVSRLPKLVSALQGSLLAVDYFQALHAEAGSLMEQAWRAYDEAGEMKFPQALKDKLLADAVLFTDLCRDTWEDWETAKKNLLSLSN